MPRHLTLFLLFLPSALIAIAGHGKTLSFTQAGLDLNLNSLNSTHATAGKPFAFELVFTKRNGQPYTDFKVFHKRRVHCLIVSQNFRSLGHIHPEDFLSKGQIQKAIGEGRFQLNYTFPYPGTYYLLIDIHGSQGFLTHKHKIKVSGTARPLAMNIDPSNLKHAVVKNLEAEERCTEAILFPHLTDNAQSDYRVEMRTRQYIVAGEDNEIDFHFKYKNKDLRALRDYLEAPLHLLIASEDMSFTLHEHGYLPGEEPEGSGSGSHKNIQPDRRYGPQIKTRIHVPRAGTYRLMCQARHGQKMIAAEFLFEAVERASSLQETPVDKPQIGKKGKYWITQKPIRGVQSLNPDQKHELSFPLLKGHRLKVRFMSTEKLSIDLHLHPGGDKKVTSYLIGAQQKSFHEFSYTVTKDDKHWLQWINLHKRKVQLQYEISLDAP